MSLDLPTSLTVAGFTLTVASGLLLMSWLYARSHQALAQWGLAFFLGAIAVALIALRGHIPDIWSIFVANTSLAAGYGIMWKGVRTFEGRPSHTGYVLAGALIWILACLVPDFYAAPAVRASLSMAIGVTYTLLSVGELWRGRCEPLVSRWPMMIVLTAHAITLPLRIPLADSLGGTAAAHPRLLAFVMFETVLFCMCAAYLFGALSKERMALRYKQSSLLDPLTAVANRRAFIKQAGRLLRRCVVGRKPVALLLFDLDRFKEINDRYGHSAGDEVLIAFCRVATGELRPTDLFARLGGEEFVSLLPDTTSKDAFAVGNRVRSAFETTAHEAGGAPFMLTVSVGMAATYGPGTDLRSLLADADRALYLAKQQGRNRVESAIGVESAPVPLSGYGRGLGFRG